MAALVVIAVVVAILAGRHSTKPDATANAYLSAWSSKDWPAMQRLVDRPPADFTAVHQGMVTDLGLASAEYQTGAVHGHGAAADVDFTGHLVLGGLGPWQLPGTLHLKRHGSHWLVEWSPATIAPALPQGGHFVVDRTWPARAAVIGAGGTPLAGQTGLVSIGLQGSAVKDPAQLTAALVQAGADPAQVSTALAQAKAHPDQFVGVFDVTDDRYQQIRPAIYPVPGTRFLRHTATGAATPDLAAHVVGSVGPVTAEELKRLGRPTRPATWSARTGSRRPTSASWPARRAATCGSSTARARPSRPLLTVADHPGTPVTTSIDLRTQQAAEPALDGVAQPAALVAVRASTGEVLAEVSRPTATPFDRALDRPLPARIDLQGHHVDRPPRRRAHAQQPGHLPRHHHRRRPHLPQLRGRDPAIAAAAPGLRHLLQHRLYRPRRPAVGPAAGHGRDPVRLRRRSEARADGVRWAGPGPDR